MQWEDIEPFRIGDGIDIGRDAIGLRIEASWQDWLDNLFDLRNVHRANGKYIETVARDEVSWNINEKLTAKGLALYHDLPKTRAGVDPFIIDDDTGEYVVDFSADPIDDGKNPSLRTGLWGFIIIRGGLRIVAYGRS